MGGVGGAGKRERGRGRERGEGRREGEYLLYVDQGPRNKKKERREPDSKTMDGANVIENSMHFKF